MIYNPGFNHQIIIQASVSLYITCHVKQSLHTIALPSKYIHQNWIIVIQNQKFHDFFHIFRISYI